MKNHPLVLIHKSAFALTLALTWTGVQFLQNTMAATDPLAATPKSEFTAPSSEPPKKKDVEWLRVPYEKAEDEVLALFQRDIPRLEEHASEVAVYEVRTQGNYPSGHHKRLRAKLERVLLTSRKLKVKQCASCDESRLYRTDSGELKYESFSTDVSRPAKVAAEVGVDHLFYSEVTYSPEDLILRMRMIKPSNGQIAWTKEYSVADITTARENLNSADPDELSHRDSLSRVMLGEIAFSMALSPGFFMAPTINTGKGTQLSGMPSIDLFIGERFDRGRRVFGFIVGGAFYTGDADKADPQMLGRPVAALFKAAPRFTYVFNPYNVSTARYSISTEAGGLLGDSVGTAYIGIGPEVKMINRYSVSITPMYISPTTAKEMKATLPQELGGGTIGGGEIGRFGGLSLLFKLGIQW